jgi:hypothetical protein
MKVYKFPEPRTLDEARRQGEDAGLMVVELCRPWLRAWTRGAPMQTRSA